MHTIDDPKDIATQSDDVGEIINSFTKYARERYLEFPSLQC
jgi:nitrogen fixation/metabolism regulation signal transduction histidine kinase